MTETQLTLDGREVQHPPRLERHLTTRQHDLLLILTARDEPMSTRDVGRLYKDPWGVMNRLAELGLVERVRRGYWRAT
jgi:hypothetical protein